jgi:hypothetical protein
MMNWENLLAFGRFGEQGKATGSDSARSEFEVDYDLPFEIFRIKPRFSPFQSKHLFTPD